MRSSPLVFSIGLGPLPFQLCDFCLKLNNDLLHLQIGPFSVLRIHVQFVHQWCDFVLKVHPPDLIYQSRQLRHNCSSCGLVAQDFYFVAGGCRTGSTLVWFLHFANDIIREIIIIMWERDIICLLWFLELFLEESDLLLKRDDSLLVLLLL
jgi:hypothetical protein